MAVFILCKLICCTLSMLSTLLLCLLRDLIVCLLVITLKALKPPGAAVQSALKQIALLIRCCLEDLLVSVLKDVLNAARTVADSFFNLAVEIVSRLVAAILKRFGAGLVNNMKSWLMELIAACWKIVLKTITTSIRLIFKLVVDEVSRSAKELAEKITSNFHELIKLTVSCWKIMLEISNTIVLFYNLLSEVIPKWLVMAGELIDQTTSAFNELTEQMKVVVEAVSGRIKQASPVIGELIKWMAGLLYDRVVDFVVKFVKQVVFGLVFGSVAITSVYGELIEQIFETVMRSVVDNVMAMVLYFWHKKFVR